MNVVWNTVEPVNFQNEGQVQGTISHIVAEVLFSKLLRRILKMEQRGFLELGVLHLLSQPFLGGVFFGEDPKNIDSTKFTEALFDGAKQTPAVLIAGVIVSTGQKGFGLPSFTIRDILITLAGKIGTRVLVTQLFGYMPEFLQKGFRQHDSLIRAQKNLGPLSNRKVSK